MMEETIERKSRHARLSRQELSAVIGEYHSGSASDEQMTGFLLAVNEAGLDAAETAYLAEAIADTGHRINWSTTQLSEQVMVDVPSTGGVGNKSPLIVPPILAAAGLLVPKMSSRGEVAGTIDILESIGYIADIPKIEFIRIVEEHGLSNICQTAELAPVDSKLMSLRRSTGTMKQPSLVVSSILAKKLATGCSNLVIDVKAGEDSKFGDFHSTLNGAALFVEVGKKLGMRVVAIVTDNDSPQGLYIGPRLSLIEVVEVLQGRGPDDQREICSFLAARALILTRRVNNDGEARRLIEDLLRSGKAFEKFVEQVKAHGGNHDTLNDIASLGQADYKVPVFSERGGYVKSISSRLVKECAKSLLKPAAGGTARTGIVLSKPPGSRVHAGEVLAFLHADDQRPLKTAKSLLYESFIISETAPNPKPKILAVAEDDEMKVLFEEFA